MNKQPPKLKDILPPEMFEGFKISIQIKTGNKAPSDEEVEKYILARLDTSDSNHSHDRKPMNTKPTFRPAT